MLEPEVCFSQLHLSEGNDIFRFKGPLLPFVFITALIDRITLVVLVYLKGYTTNTGVGPPGVL